ncbi:hypothetical protein HOI18_01525 [Candidatus Uhrbacteria bacterium]|nr:hypothetical protein [Candidatus Uhrbacteria bacterium]
MKKLTVFILAAYPTENWLRRTRQRREPTLFEWLDAEDIELFEVQWDGRIDALIKAFRRGDQFVVRASNYMNPEERSNFRGNPKPDWMGVVVRTCAALGIPIFYNGHIMHPSPVRDYDIEWSDHGRGKDELIEALSPFVVET